MPRELTPYGERSILRYAGANVAELRWWLHQLPSDTDAVVVENSAISPELQRVCPDMLAPVLTVFTNTFPDHEALWGRDERAVLAALSGALPRGGAVVLPQALAKRHQMRLLALEQELTLHAVEPMTEFSSYLSANIPLAIEACRLAGVEKATALAAMRSVAADIADSSVIHTDEWELAFAFSINDLQSTREYFTSLGWLSSQTSLIYNHRMDRVDRFRAFEEWMKNGGWKNVVIIGDRPPFSSLARRYRKIKSMEEFIDLLTLETRILGCGNAVHGLPLAFRLTVEGEI
ncbi:MAG: capsule biosynthesis protein CapB [Synergistaceae bacterium]|nr:capsule biosynthesis protein CapB [Synergistaceae bacterium]